MKEKLTENQAKAILKALDDAIQQGPWDESNFLRVIGKNLREIRKKFSEQINELSIPAGKDIFQTSPAALKAGEQEVFIGLYSNEGNNLQAWERILSNLSRQVVSRPIYANEKDIIYFIKEKENKVNEAYVVARINQEDILELPVDKIPRDKFGKPLILLKDRALLLENIVRFTHLSTHYDYLKGRLIKKSSPESS